MDVQHATVTQVSPLRVRLDGASKSSAATLIGSAPVLHDRVRVLVAGSQVVALTGGPHSVQGGLFGDYNYGTSRVPNSDLNQGLRSGFYNGSALANAPTSRWVYVLVQSHGNGPHWQRQVVYEMQDGATRVWDRACQGGDPTLAASWTGWREVGGDTGWALLPLAGTATAYSTDLANQYAPRYRKVAGVVHLAGLVNTGATTNPIHVATLPAGFRPATGIMSQQITSGAILRRLDITSNGYLTFREATGTVHSSWHNVQCSFLAEA